MGQEVNNNSNIEQQLNASNSTINFHKKSRYSKRFEKLKDEFLNNQRYEEVLDELKGYLTRKDGIDMPQKLEDGGFSENEIIRATERKQKYWKKYEKYKFYESAQRIDAELFAKIKIDFETYIEIPLINSGASKEVIMKAVLEKVVNPILFILNEDGAEDEILNYNAEEIFGMIYHLTGNCHLYWKNYDNI